MCNRDSAIEIVQYTIVQYVKVQYTIVQYTIVQYAKVQYTIVQYTIVQYAKVQYYLRLIPVQFKRVCNSQPCNTELYIYLMFTCNNTMCNI